MGMYTETLVNTNFKKKMKKTEQEALARARELHGSPEVEIDSHPVFSWGERGVWVSAWVYVPFDEVGEPDLS